MSMSLQGLARLGVPSREIRLMATARVSPEVSRRSMGVEVWPGVTALVGTPTRRGRFSLAPRSDIVALADADADWVSDLALHTIRDVVISDLMRPLVETVPVWTNGPTAHAATSLLVDRLWAKIRLAYRPRPIHLWAVAASGSRIFVTNDAGTVPHLRRLGDRAAATESHPLPVRVLRFAHGRWAPDPA